MKSIIFILLACFSGLFFSCNKQNNNQALATTGLPAELSYLKGGWDVVDYFVDSGWQGPQPDAQPGFHYMKLGVHSVAFYGTGDEIKSGSFRFTKNDKSGLYRFTFLGGGASLTHWIFMPVTRMIRFTLIASGMMAEPHIHS